MERDIRSYLYLLASIAVFIAAWWVLALIIHNPQAMASPYATAQAFGQLYMKPSIRSLFLVSLGQTLSSVFEGFALAAVVGIPVGFLMGLFPRVEYTFDPLINAMYSIPAIAFVPLLMPWLGLTSTATIAIAFILAVFSTIINIYIGARNVSRTLVETSRAFGASRTQTFVKVIFPATLPMMMLGLRLSLSRALEGVIVAEMIFSVLGIGGMIFDTADKLQMGLTFALIIVLAAISIFLNEFMKYINRKVVFWPESTTLARR